MDVAAVGDLGTLRGDALAAHACLPIITVVTVEDITAAISEGTTFNALVFAGDGGRAGGFSADSIVTDLPVSAGITNDKVSTAIGDSAALSVLAGRNGNTACFGDAGALLLTEGAAEGVLVAVAAFDKTAAAVGDHTAYKACLRAIGDLITFDLDTLTALFSGSTSEAVRTFVACDGPAAAVRKSAALNFELFTGEAVGTVVVLGICVSVCVSVGVGMCTRVRV